MAQKQTQSHDVDAYKHNDAKRLNAIPAGVAPYYADDDGDAAHYDFDPNMDPRLDWSGKAEKSHLCVPIVGIHVHERMTSERVVRALLADWVSSDDKHSQGDLFESDALRRKRQADSLEAYLHSEAWANSLIAGDSLLVMNSLLRKESMAGKVQCVYMDPPYGISYGSNFQAFTGKRDVKDKKDEDLPYQPEMGISFPRHVGAGHSLVPDLHPRKATRGEGTTQRHGELLCADRGRERPPCAVRDGRGVWEGELC